MCQRNREMKVFYCERRSTPKLKGDQAKVIMEGDSGGDSDMDSYCSNCGDIAPGRRGNKHDVSWTVAEVSSEQLFFRRWPSSSSPSSQIVIHNLVKMGFLALIVFLAGSSTFPPLVSAVDLNPHGGFYQREGGINSFRPSSTQQSIFGGGGGGLGHTHGHASGSPDFADDMMGDMIMTCSRPTKSSRAAKYLAIKKLDIPCDMGDRKSAWCNLPGDKYPWHAVRRFVFENQGLMRRMYGEVRQLSLLRMEFEDDLDDEIEDERHSPPRSPPIPEDHRRNSILTEVLDESLPRVLSETPPGDQLLLREHQELFRERAASTPRSFPSSFPSSPSSSSPASSPDPVTLTSTTSATLSTEHTAAATITPVMMSSSSEEQLNSTEVMLGVTVDSLSGAIGDLNGTTTITTTGETENTASTPGMTTNIGRNGLTEDFLITEEVTQATASATGSVTETEKEMEESGEAIVTTTEEMLVGLSEQMPLLGEGESQLLEVGGAAVPLGVDPMQQLNDGLQDPTASMGGSDESHDFLNLDKNHILYFDDVGKNRRPVGGNNGGAGGSGEYVPEAPQGSQSVPAQQGKLKAVNACPVKEEVVAPYWANNTRGEILALLNLYPFEQYIHWERCNHENKQMFCRQGCRCEQQYRLHRLLAFDPTNECRGIFSDWFRFPSCCVCRCYLNEYELMMLNAAGQDPPPGSSSAAKSRTSDRIRSPRKLLLEQLVDGPDVQGVDDMHFFYKQGFSHEHNHGAQPRRKRNLFSS